MPKYRDADPYLKEGVHLFHHNATPLLTTGKEQWRCNHCRRLLHVDPDWKKDDAGRYKEGSMPDPHMDICGSMARKAAAPEPPKPINIITELPATFKEDAQSAKWQDRKSALDSLQQLLSDNPHLSPNQNYKELVDLLKKKLNDPDINVCSASAKCLTLLATRLSTKFKCFAPSVMSVVFEKFKEKKAVLLDPLILCADAIGTTTDLNAITKSLLKAMDKPNPNIKVQTINFLSRHFKHTEYKCVPSKDLNALVTILKKHASDPDAEVSESAYMALGSIMKCNGQGAARRLFGTTFMDDADHSEQVLACFNKITEAEAAKSTVAKPQEEATAALPARHLPATTDQDQAAIKIQSLVRGYLARCEYERIRKQIQDQAAIKIQSLVRGYLARCEYERIRKQIQDQAAIKIQSLVRGYLARCEYERIRKQIQASQFVTRRKGRTAPAPPQPPQPCFNAQTPQFPAKVPRRKPAGPKMQTDVVDETPAMNANELESQIQTSTDCAVEDYVTHRRRHTSRLPSYSTFHGALNEAASTSTPFPRPFRTPRPFEPPRTEPRKSHVRIIRQHETSFVQNATVRTAIHAENSPHLSPQSEAGNTSQELGENPLEVFYYLRGFTHTRTTLNYLLHVCEQDNVMPWNMFAFDRKKCKKLGEGAYGEVFQSIINGEMVAMKVVPFQDKDCYHDGLVNGERMKQTMEILPEVLITKELSELRNATRYSTPTFVRLIQAAVIRGDYPKQLITAWGKFKEKVNQRPDTYSSPNQLFMVFALSLGGKDLEAYEIQNEEQAFSIFFQIALSLAIAEETLEFEHRDLHIGNVLIAPCLDSETISFTLNGSAIKIKSCGVIASIIDFTNSRMQKEGTIIFLDLSEDEELFKGKGDYQFDIYREMRHKNGDRWKDFTPRTNILWLHYLASKMFNSEEIIEQLNVLLTFDRIKLFLENSAVIEIFERYKV